MNRFAGYHWADGGSQRLGLDRVASCFTNGKPWSERYRYAGDGKFVKTTNMAYIVEKVAGGYWATYRKPDLGWEEMTFEPGSTLEEVQAAVETILKLQEEDEG